MKKRENISKAVFPLRRRSDPHNSHVNPLKCQLQHFPKTQKNICSIYLKKKKKTIHK